jgi:hypothetical protein
MVVLGTFDFRPETVFSAVYHRAGLLQGPQKRYKIQTLEGRIRGEAAVSFVRVLLLSIIANRAMVQAFHPVIPRAWDDREVDAFEVPLAQPERSPRYLSVADYYALEVMSICRSYHVYALGREPTRYVESPKQRQPEIVFDPGLSLETSCP